MAYVSQSSRVFDLGPREVGHPCHTPAAILKWTLITHYGLLLDVSVSINMHFGTDGLGRLVHGQEVEATDLHCHSLTPGSDSSPAASIGRHGVRGR